MFKTRRQLKREIASLEALLSVSNKRADKLLKEAAEINANADKERKELADTIESQRQMISNLRRNCTDYNTAIRTKDDELKKAQKALEAANKEIENLRGKLTRKHCNTVAKKWRKSQEAAK